MRRGLVSSRERAREVIAAGQVLVAGAPATKPARLVDADEPLRVLSPPPRFVGRGGEKLDAALARFDVDVDGRTALDAGASTGGFTDCLLQRGAAAVVAVDVGYGQLHERLRADTRVVNLERTNIRHLGPDALDAVGGPVDVVVGDLSFISLRTVLPGLVVLARSDGDLVLLVKPQFEAGRSEVSRGRGVVRDPGVWRAAIGDVVATAVDRGCAMMGAMVSPLTGAEGNVEFLVHLRAPGSHPPPSATVDLDEVVARALETHAG